MVKLNIAIIGTRGIPNRYGGFEACAEQIGVRLVKAGHKLTVYCPHNHPVKDIEWNGIQRIRINNPETRFGTIGQFIYDLRCNLDSRRQDFDIILHFGYTSDSIWKRFWSKTAIHIVNMDGLEWKRAKYNNLTKKFLLYAERLAAKKAHILIADNPGMEAYLTAKYKTTLKHIAYGANIPASYEKQSIKELGLVAGEYDLMVARMEPENNILMAIEAKIGVQHNIPLVIIGNLNKYRDRMRKKYQSHDNIRFLDPVYDANMLNNMRYFSRYYIHGHSVGGTNPSLLEAMACQCAIVAHENDFNHSILNQQGLYFNCKEQLTEILSKQPDQNFVKWKEENSARITEKYNWDSVTRAYEQIFIDTINAT